jgi:hypothetical protein
MYVPYMQSFFISDSNLQRRLYFLKAAVLVFAMMLRIRHALTTMSITNASLVSKLNIYKIESTSLLILLGVNRDLITATAVIAGLGSFMFGFLTNLPVALAYVLIFLFSIRIANVE